MDEFKDIAYIEGSTFGTWHDFDLYVPGGQPAPRPLVVFVHGGAWRSEDKAKHSELARRLARETACAVAVPNYRLTTPETGLKHPGHAEDLLAFLEYALRWEGPRGPRHPQYDPSRLYLVGHSCSAHMIASILLAPPADSPKTFPSLVPSDALVAAVRGVIATEGLYDIDLLLQSFPSYKDWFIANTFGEDALYTTYSVSRYDLRAGAEEIRWLVLHSLKDPLVDVLQSETMVQHLQVLQANVESFLQLTSDDHNGVLLEDKYHELVSGFISRVESKEQDGQK